MSIRQIDLFGNEVVIEIGKCDLDQSKEEVQKEQNEISKNQGTLPYFS